MGARRAIGDVRVVAPIWDRRLILVTGKGGVGKTSLTAALARAAHARGARVLVGEVTPTVHSPSPLFALFSKPRFNGEHPTELEPRLMGVRLSPSGGHKLFLRAALKVKLLVEGAMRSAALQRFLAAAPTFPEIGVLYQLVSVLREVEFDHFILDLPATGHALGLAALPKVVNRIVPSGLIGDAIREGNERLADPEYTRAVVVTLPEAMPVAETGELIAGLRKHDVSVGAAILNRMPPDPFVGDERVKLRAFLDTQRPALRGSKELKRLERAVAAREAFYATMPTDLIRFETPFHGETDDRAVVRAIEADLLRGFS